MNDSSARSGLKVDIFMPLYIGRYLQDTSHLDAMKSGALLHLLMYIWVRGPLPNEPETLATIAKLTPDAWSMSQASLMQFFFVGQDGMLHQRGAERLKEQWVAKRQKAREKAIKAANARWSKHKAKGGEREENIGHAPSITQALPEQCPISVVQVQKQKQPIPTLPTRREGIDPKTIPRPAGRSQLRKSPRQVGKLPRPLGASGRRVGTSPAHPKSKGLAKPPQRAPAGATNGHNGLSPAAPAAVRMAGVQAGGSGAFKIGSNGSGGDPRRAGFRAEVLAFWRGMNPKHPNCPWKQTEDRALNSLLEQHPEMSIETLRVLLANRAHSDINPASLPHKWLRNILEYSAGPLGKYGRPQSQARSF